ncbi:hypothetical protein ACIQCJ_29850 [Streptomyces sp. NPDC093221]|uniref:hypothetical protein n=1 Tax=Streptomyces sp. NPDC093221 TaxID=3366032 RepID=UPI00381C82F6
MTEHERPKGVLRVSDRIRFEDRVHTVVGLSGTAVRLLDEHNTASMLMFTHLMVSQEFELLDSTAPTPAIPPFGLLDTVPEVALRKARFYERHLIEVETRLPPDAPKGTVPRPEYDPQWRTVNERVVSKAAGLTAAGNEVSDRTLFRLRSKWRDEGLWGLVDRRATRLSMVPGIGRVDERLAEAVLKVLAAQEDASSGTRTRVIRLAEKLVAERHGQGAVPAFSGRAAGCSRSLRRWPPVPVRWCRSTPRRWACWLSWTTAWWGGWRRTSLHGTGLRRRPRPPERVLHQREQR